jgi:hypothetical protein
LVVSFGATMGTLVNSIKIDFFCAITVPAPRNKNTSAMLFGESPLLGSVEGDPLHMDMNCLDKGLHAAGVESTLHFITIISVFVSGPATSGQFGPGRHQALTASA